MKGLSPRARGKRAFWFLATVEKGSIPACAGEAMFRQSGRIHHRVYPRVRGGSVVAFGSCLNLPGLSPRARGKHHGIAEIGKYDGSIPACAGEAPSARM